MHYWTFICLTVAGLGAALPPKLADPEISRRRMVRSIPEEVYQVPGSWIARGRRDGAKRPKYDPALQWLGLGKRSSAVEPTSAPIINPLMSVSVLSNMLRFFDELSEDIEAHAQKNFDSTGDDQIPEILEETLQDVPAPSIPLERSEDLTGKTPDRRFSTRSKNLVPIRKSTLNPSLLMSGLGRK